MAKQSIILKNVPIAYAKVRKNHLNQKKNTKHEADAPYKNKEVSVDFLVPVKVAKQWKKDYKDRTTVRKVMKLVAVEDILERYRLTELPEGFEVDGEVYSCKLSHQAAYKSGDLNEKRLPQIVGTKKVGKDFYDKNGKLVSGDVMIGNGTLVNLQINPDFQFTDLDGSVGYKFYLQAIQILDLVEVELSKTLFEFDEEEAEEDDDEEGFDVEEEEAPKPSRRKASKPDEPDVDQEDDDDSWDD